MVTREASAPTCSRSTTVARVPLRTPSRVSLRRQRTRSPTRNSRSPSCERIRTEATGANKQRPRRVVEVPDVGAPVSEHDAAGEVVLRGLPPVFEQPLFCRRRIVVEVEASVAGGVREVGLGTPSRSGASALRSERSRWRRLSARSIAPSRSQRAGKRPPAPTGGSWCGSPTRIAFPSARSTSSSSGASTRVSAIPASSTTSTQPWGRPPSRCASSSSRWSVQLAMPVAALSSSAARPLGAAPSTGMLALTVGVGEERAARSSCPSLRRRRRRRHAPVGGGLVDEHPLLARELPPDSSSDPRAESSCPAGGAPTSRPASASSSASRSTCEQLPVVNRAGRPGRLSVLERARCPGARERAPPSSSTSLDSGPVSERAGDRAARARASRTSSVLRSARPGRTAARRAAPRSPGRERRGRSRTSRFELAAAEPVLGRARLPLVPQPRQVDLLLRLPGRERGDTGSGEALRADRLHVLDKRLPPAWRRPGSPPRARRSARPSP